MKFTEDDYKRFQSLDQLEEEIFTTEEIKGIHNRALIRSKMRAFENKMFSDVSLFLKNYISQNQIDIDKLLTDLQISSQTFNSILENKKYSNLRTLLYICVALELDVGINISKLDK